MKLRLSKDEIKFWLNRLIPVLICAVVLMALINLYNIWSGLTLFYFVRRLAISTSLLALALGPSIFFRKNKSRLIYLLAVSTILSLLMIVNYTYSRYAGGFLSVSALQYARHLFEVSGSVKTLLDIRQILLLMPIFISLGLLVFFKGFVVDKKKLTKIELAICSTALVLIVASGLGYTFYKEYKEWGDVSRLINHPYNSDDLVRKIGIINYSVYDVAKYATKKKSLNKQEIALVRQNSPAVMPNRDSNPMTGLAKGKNIIYVQLESFQNFLIGKKVGDQEITPNLNRLAETSDYFTNFHYQVGPGTSSDSEFVVLNSLYHLGDKAVNFDYPGNQYYALPKFLDEKGYFTVAMHADSPNFWNRGTVFANFGYEKFITREQYNGGNILWGLNDNDFFAQSADKLTEFHQPFFAHLISLSSHSPFKLPQQYQTMDLSSLNINELQKNYLQATHYSDEAFGKLIEKLKEKGIYDNTVILVGGDHEAFISSQNDIEFAKFLGHDQGFDDLSYVRARQIPFIVHLPGQQTQKLIDFPVGQINVYPMVTNLIGEKAPSTTLGENVFGVPSPTVTTRKRSIGQNIEMILSSNLTYISGTSGDFAEGKCYEHEQKVDVEKCKALYDRESKKMLISDKVVEGNSLDLLKN